MSLYRHSLLNHMHGPDRHSLLVSCLCFLLSCYFLKIRKSMTLSHFWLGLCIGGWKQVPFPDPASRNRPQIFFPFSQIRKYLAPRTNLSTHVAPEPQFTKSHRWTVTLVSPPPTPLSPPPPPKLWRMVLSQTLLLLLNLVTLPTSHPARPLLAASQGFLWCRSWSDCVIGQGTFALLDLHIDSCSFTSSVSQQEKYHPLGEVLETRGGIFDCHSCWEGHEWHWMRGNIYLGVCSTGTTTKKCHVSCVAFKSHTGHLCRKTHL